VPFQRYWSLGFHAYWRGVWLKTGVSYLVALRLFSIKETKLKMLYNQASKWSRHGFTLMEILVTLVIISLIASVVTVSIFNSLEGAKRDSAKTQIESLGGGLDRFRLNVGRYPTTEEGLDTLVHAPENVENWKGPYIKKGKKIPKDPWKHDYIYTFPGIHGDYDLVSFGADGIPGGEGNNADIVSWDE